uniref:Uncharacterized protein n=1 Tax=Rhizophora mucronata TaxID=61149 RepID=A0A2P2JYF6_RHIMU
MGPPNPTN